MGRRVLTAVLAAIVAIGLAPAPSPAASAAPTAPPPAWPGVTCPAPQPGPRAVVQLAYIVLLRRCPDPAGAAAWEASLRDGMAVETFARRIASTPESRGIVAGDAYEQVLDRPATAGERAFWAGWLRPDPTRTRRHDQLLAELAASAEMYAQAGNDDEAWVALVYERLLGRPASTADRDYWVGRLEDLPSDRRALTRMLLRLTEPLGATVDEVWLQVLGTTNDPVDRQHDIARLRATGDRLGLAAHLVATDGFQAKSQARALVVPGRYVALGDSYVVGEGNGMVHGGAGELGCRYADSAYPEVARTSSAVVPSDLDVAACSGASLLGLYPFDSPHGGGPGQIDVLAEGATPDLVTLTIGGNDIGFTSLVERCLQVRNTAGQQLNPAYDAAGCDEVQDDAPERIEDLRAGLPTGEGYDCGRPTCSLTGAVEDLVAAAPDAEVVVVGYPPLMPAVDSGCAGPVRDERGAVVTGLTWSIAPRHVQTGRAIIAELNDALHDAAVEAGATFVDPGPGFAGHEVCSPQPWIHGLVLSSGGVDTSTFHPTRRGGVGVAAALVAALED